MLGIVWCFFFFVGFGIHVHVRHRNERGWQKGWRDGMEICMGYICMGMRGYSFVEQTAVEYHVQQNKESLRQTDGAADVQTSTRTTYHPPTRLGVVRTQKWVMNVSHATRIIFILMCDVRIQMYTNILHMRPYALKSHMCTVYTHKYFRVSLPAANAANERPNQQQTGNE